MALKQTNADAVMIGRAAQGRPWIFKEINYYLEHGKHLPALQANIKNCILLNHLEALYDFYGEEMGVRIARKHITWYCKEHANTEIFRKNVNQVETAKLQLQRVSEFFHSIEGKPLAA